MRYFFFLSKKEKVMRAVHVRTCVILTVFASVL